MRMRRRVRVGHTWRDVPLTNYEAGLLQQLAEEPGNAGTWRGTLLGQIADRFHSHATRGVRF